MVWARLRMRLNACSCVIRWPRIRTPGDYVSGPTLVGLQLVNQNRSFERHRGARGALVDLGENVVQRLTRLAR
jgi:hypothetical protein